MKHVFLHVLIAVITFHVAVSTSMAGQPEIDLWPKGVPEPVVPKEPAEETVTGPDGLTRRFNVSRPRLFVHAPPKSGTGSRAAIIVVPGGGYGRLADEHEGSDVCQWLQSKGIFSFQLAYRTPTNRQAEPATGPVQDLHRSIAVVRERAVEFDIDPDRIGVIGFSAGGLTSFLAAASSPSPSVVAQSSASVKPNALLLIYPWKVWNDQTNTVHAAATLESSFPPTFIAQAADDTASSASGSAKLFLALTELKVPTEFHVYEKGGHGFGMRPREGAPGTLDWQHRASDWLKLRGFAD